MKRGVSKQDGQTSSSLNWPTAMALFQGHRTTGCTNRYFSGRCTKLSWKVPQSDLAQDPVQEVQLESMESWKELWRE